MNFRISSESEWMAQIPTLISAMGNRKILCLEGDLGAGKTTFTKSLFKHLESQDMVQSPTFSLINTYNYIQNGQNLMAYHIDLYRLNRVEDALEIGIEEIIDSGSLCIIEWPQIIYPILDDNYVLMQINLQPDGLRSVSFN